MATFIRFAVAARDEHSDQQRGIIQDLHVLERTGALLPHELEWCVGIYEDGHQIAAIPFTNETF